MATSGTFTSGRYGHSSYGPWLTLAWTQVSQSVANNTTTLDLTLRFHWDQDINYTFNNKKGSVQGNSYTYSGSISGVSGSRVLKTQRVTITHNSNGTKSVSLSGNITSLGMYWYSGGTTIGTMSVSGTATLETIPRASTLSAFSFNANLKNGTANQIKYTIDRKSDAFRHHIELRDGNTILRTWDNQSSDGESTLPLTATEVNTLLNRMSTTTTKSYTLRVTTRSGNNGSWIGSAVSRNATATVHDDVKPTVSAVTLSQDGNPVSTHTLQGFSKIKAKFTRSAGYGATISSSSIQVRRRSGGSDSQTINSNDGTTSNAVSLHGVYEARGTTRDSRGRTNNTAWATITVTAYNAPTITTFTAARNGSTPTTVDITRATTHTVLGTSNHLTYTVQRRQGTGAWTNVNTNGSGTITSNPSSSTSISTGNSVTSSYEFRYVVTDKLGRRAESLRSVSTQRVVLDIHKNEGVGIGKIREQGVLDVDGDAYFKGRIIADRTAVYYPYGTGSEIDNNYNNITTEWSLVSAVGAMQNRPPNVSDEIGGGSFVYLNTMHYSNSYKKQIAYGYTSNQVWTRYSYGGTWSNWVEIGGRSGSNSNGRWFRMSDGLQICIMYIIPDRRTSELQTRVFPLHFHSDVVLSVTPRNGSAAAYLESNASLQASLNQTTQTTEFKYQFLKTTSTGYDWFIRVVAIGRWY